MAETASGYWTSLIDLTPPPSDWLRIATVHRNVPEMSLWANDVRHKGQFCWHYRAILEHNSEDEAIGETVWAFSDRDVAFEFRLRFG